MQGPKHGGRTWGRLDQDGCFLLGKTVCDQTGHKSPADGDGSQFDRGWEELKKTQSTEPVP
jgi:hypothetical protein